MDSATDPKSKQENPNENQTSPDVVWSFRGYQLKASELTTALVHFFRAEVSRANVWRQRLDTTTNWAVVTTGAAISIAFAQEGNPAVMLINLLLVTIFLTIEARRYRYYELWSYRVRLMETDFFAAMLVPPFHPSVDWAESLADTLLHPDFPISTLEAVGRRLRRNYLFIYSIIGVSWFGRLWLLPYPAKSWSVIEGRMGIGSVTGAWVFGIVLLFYASLILISFGTIGLHQASGEVLPRFGAQIDVPIPGNGEPASIPRAWFRHSHRRRQLLVVIITHHAEQVSAGILSEMKRGVTALSGTGMFTGQPKQVLLCALTITEIPQLKEIVRQKDPSAFVIVSPAQDIFGKGFIPLEDIEN